MSTFFHDLKFGARTARQDPGVHRGRGAVARARHRGQHHDFHARERRAAEPAAGRRPVAARVGLDDRRAQPRRRPRSDFLPDLADELQGPAGQERGVFRDDRPRRAAAELHRQGRAAGADLRRARDRQLLLGARRAARRSAAASSPTRTETPGEKLVAVLGYGFWQQRLGGDPSIVGRTIKLNGHAFTVVGVMPKGFKGTNAIGAPALWVPFMTHPQTTQRLFPELANADSRRGADLQHHRPAQAGRDACGRPRPT